VRRDRGIGMTVALILSGQAGIFDRADPVGPQNDTYRYAPVKE